MTTTVAIIRDRIAAVITALSPTYLAGDKFRTYQAEGPGDFVAWAEQTIAGWRRFSVRDLGAESEPRVSDASVEWREAVFEILIAYPHTHRAGEQNALDRDDAMRADQLQIEAAIGQHGGANLAGIATWVADGYAVDRLMGLACDFLSIRQRMGFYRSV